VPFAKRGLRWSYAERGGDRSDTVASPDGQAISGAGLGYTSRICCAPRRHGSPPEPYGSGLERAEAVTELTARAKYVLETV
jgi:hypothetical protein